MLGDETQALDSWLTRPSTGSEGSPLGCGLQKGTNAFRPLSSESCCRQVTRPGGILRAEDEPQLQVPVCSTNGQRKKNQHLGKANLPAGLKARCMGGQRLCAQFADGQA